MIKAEKPRYENLRFKSKEGFSKWLTIKTKLIVCFEDKGQDFLTWYIDERGEVLHSTPCQSAIWNGKMVDVKSLKKGRYLFFQDGACVKYKIKKVSENKYLL